MEERLFKLVSNYKPTGDQPNAIKYLSDGIKEGKKFQTLLGVTGSFLDADFDGTSPANTVNAILNPISNAAGIIPSEAIFLTLNAFSIIVFIIEFRNIVIIIPIPPAMKPSINVSALNNLETSFLLAPIALKIPISFVLSRTLI